MKKIVNILYKSSIILFIVISTFILLLNINQTLSNKNYLEFIIIVLVFIIIFTIKHKNITEKFPKFNIKLLFIILITIFAILIFIIGFATRVGLNWDYKEVMVSALDVAKGGIGNLAYFARYQNNVPLLIFESILAKIGLIYNQNLTIIGLQSITIIINCIITISSIILMNYTVKKSIGEKTFYIVSILSTLYCPLYLYSTILYTDTIGLLLFTISMYMYYIYSKSTTTKSKILSLTFFILSVAIGFKFKATNIFILIAVLIDLFHEKKYKEILINIALLVAIMLPINLLIENSYNISQEEINKNQFPYSHWIMMSLNPNTNGGYNQTDVNFTRESGNIEEKKEAISNEIQTRINNYGVAALLERVFITKNNRTWAEPTLATSDYLNRDTQNSNIITDLVTKDGKYFKAYSNYISIIYKLILIGIIISGIYNYKNKQKYVYIAQLMIIGIFIFELIWECNSRYIYSFLPFLLITSGYGYAKLISKRQE